MNPNAVAQLDTAIADITRQFQNLATQMQQLSSSLQRLATAGLNATTEGNRLSYVWMLFTRQIAAVALPVVNFLIEKLTKLTEWFRNLSGDAQFLILKIGLMATAITVVTPLVGLLISAISPLTAVMAVLVPALTYFFTETSTGIAVVDAMTEALKWATENWITIKNVFEVAVGSIVKAFQVVVAGFMWLGIQIVGIIEEIVSWIPGLGDVAESIKKFRENGEKQHQLLINDIATPINVSTKDDKQRRPRQDVNPTGFGFESLAASYERITSAANKQDLARESLDVQKKQLAALDAIKEGVMKPMEVGMSVGGDF